MASNLKPEVRRLKYKKKHRRRQQDSEQSLFGEKKDLYLFRDIEFRRESTLKEGSSFIIVVIVTSGP